MNKATKIKRLTMLKDMLENHDKVFPKNFKFNMRDWFKGKSTKGKALVDCGSAGCALGSAACYPPFKELGLKLKEDKDDGSIEPVFEGECGYEAGAEFFGIDIRKAYFLFDPYKYNDGDIDLVCRKVTPDMVARRVQVVIDDIKIS